MHFIFFTKTIPNPSVSLLMNTSFYEFIVNCYVIILFRYKIKCDLINENYSLIQLVLFNFHITVCISYFSSILHPYHETLSTIHCTIQKKLKTYNYIAAHMHT